MELKNQSGIPKRSVQPGPSPLPFFALSAWSLLIAVIFLLIFLLSACENETYKDPHPYGVASLNELEIETEFLEEWRTYHDADSGNNDRKITGFPFQILKDSHIILYI
ncbi:MAG TPA: hypothetical protein VKN36_06390 [Eudoraea sp.]|nr:hypothetical protein [Eudoraea sp.]